MTLKRIFEMDDRKSEPEEEKAAVITVEKQGSSKLQDQMTKVDKPKPLISVTPAGLDDGYEPEEGEVGIADPGTQSNQEMDGSSEGEGESDLHRIHMLQSLQALQYLKGVEIPQQYHGRQIRLPTRRRVIVFDMDETLIHCVEDIEEECPQHIVSIQFDDEPEPIEAGINIRPFAEECLREANKYFYVVVWTASMQTYADAVLDLIDPDRELIQKRLYRDSCYQTDESVYIKDLRLFKGLDMRDVVIVDNAVYSFGFQLLNGIPIIPFYEDPEDEELYHLIPFMEVLADADDIRVKNQEAFKLDEMAQQDLHDVERLFAES